MALRKQHDYLGHPICRRMGEREDTCFLPSGGRSSTNDLAPPSFHSQVARKFLELLQLLRGSAACALCSLDGKMDPEQVQHLITGASSIMIDLEFTKVALQDFTPSEWEALKKVKTRTVNTRIAKA